MKLTLPALRDTAVIVCAGAFTAYCLDEMRPFRKPPHGARLLRRVLNVWPEGVQEITPEELALRCRMPKHHVTGGLADAGVRTRILRVNGEMRDHGYQLGEVRLAADLAAVTR